MALRTIGMVLLVGTLSASTALGQAYSPRPRPREAFDRPRDAGAAFGAAAINVVYMPARLAVSALGVAASGIVGFLTAGNSQAADDVWGLVKGPAYITPAMLRGREVFRFGPWVAE